MWVLSHVVAGNEKADKIVYEASLSHNALKLKLTISLEALLTINRKILETWQKNWNDVPLKNKFRNIKPLVKKWNFPSNLKRKNKVIINRVRIGHTHLTHSFPISKEPAPVYDISKENLSVNHIVIRCPKYAEARTIFNNPTLL